MKGRTGLETSQVSFFFSFFALLTILFTIKLRVYRNQSTPIPIPQSQGSGSRPHHFRLTFSPAVTSSDSEDAISTSQRTQLVVTGTSLRCFPFNDILDALEYDLQSSQRQYSGTASSPQGYHADADDVQSTHMFKIVTTFLFWELSRRPKSYKRNYQPTASSMPTQSREAAPQPQRWARGQAS
jgi:hypothetical protein